jgi:hypothetical protein
MASRGPYDVRFEWGPAGAVALAPSSSFAREHRARLACGRRSGAPWSLSPAALMASSINPPASERARVR